MDILKRIDDPVGQAFFSNALAWLLFDDHQLGRQRTLHLARSISTRGKAKNTASVNFMGSLATYTHRRERKFIHHFEKALGVASLFDWHHLPFWIHCSLAQLFCDGRKLNDANVHIKQTKSPAVNAAYGLGRVAHIQAESWYRNAGSNCRNLLQAFERAMKTSSSTSMVNFWKKHHILRLLLPLQHLGKDAQGADNGSGGYSIPECGTSRSFFFRGQFPLHWLASCVSPIVLCFHDSAPRQYATSSFCPPSPTLPSQRPRCQLTSAEDNPLFLR